MTEIVLASASPRRRELMKRVAPDFRIHPSAVDESSIRESDPVRLAIRAAVLKAKGAAESFPSAIVIGADTVVALGPRILGKPEDRESARDMLRFLSGQRHKVVTGVALFRKDENRLLADYELTYVAFRELTGEAIEAYLDSGDFLDKAGAYAIQDIGDAFVRDLKGDYDNVVGFPVRRVNRLLALFQRPSFSVIVEDSAFPENSGIAFREGRRILIPGAVAGDRVRIHVVREGGNAEIGEVLSLDKPSPFRAAPECPHFGTCGGCLFQDLDYGKQLELKARHLGRILDEAGLSGLGSGTVGPVVPSPEIYYYRNKMEFAFGNDEGEVVLGLRERKSDQRGALRRTVPLHKCPISSPAVESLFPPVLEFARENGLLPFRASTGEGVLRHLVVREAKRTGELMVLLVTSAEPGVDLAALAARLRERIPGLAGFHHVVNSRISDAVVFEKIRLVSGRPVIEEELDGLTFRISPRTFFQTNTAAAERLYRRIRDTGLVTPESRVLGLYCGTGAIEISLAAAAKEVMGIDSLPENIRIAEENRAANKVTNVSFHEETVEKFLKHPPPASWDVLVVDPPRAGISPKALGRMVALNVPGLIYVSCNPKTLAGDLAALTSHGYRIASLEPFDFFPHTPHLEILTILQKD